MHRSAFLKNCLCALLITCPYPVMAQNGAHNDMTLGDALNLASQNNPSLQAAREELKETEELYPQARAGWLPTLSAETSIYATDIENSNFGTADGTTTKDMTLSLNQPLFRGGRTFAETARARDLIRAGNFLLRQTEQEIALKTATAYTNLLRDREILKLRKENEEILKTELKAAQERHELGETTITDMHQAKVRYQRAKSETIAADNNQKSSEAKFLEIVGTDPGNLEKPDTSFNFPSSLEDIILTAEKQNPEIWIARHRYQAAEHDTDAVLRELFPQISAFASYNRQYDPQPGIVDRSKTETVGLRATLSLYEGGATRSRIRKARQAAKRQNYEIEEIRQKIRQEITSNWRSYLAARAETKSRKEEINAAELALKGVREEARLGQRSVLDILDADQEVIDAKTMLVKAERNELVTRFAVAADLGMLKFNGD